MTKNVWFPHQNRLEPLKHKTVCHYKAKITIMKETTQLRQVKLNFKTNLKVGRVDSLTS